MSRGLRLAAFGTWAVAGVPVLAGFATTRTWGPAQWAWALAFALFGAGLALAFHWRESHPGRSSGCIALQVGAAIAANALAAPGWHASSIGAGLFVVVAAQLSLLRSAWLSGAVIALQAAVAGALVMRFSSVGEAAGFAAALLGFQQFAFFATDLMRREASARRTLAEANAELVATRALLAKTSRNAERLRIARELHDSVGHHLAALSLELEVASRHPAGQLHVRRAQAIARSLLGEVRTVVSEMRESREADLAGELRALAAQAPAQALDVQLSLPDPLEVHDVDRAHALVRCVQELITNAVRHSRARHLWIDVVQREDGIDLRARDDGRGSEGLRMGNGLRGMRERLAPLHGRAEFATAPGQGFEARVFLPVAEARA